MTDADERAVEQDIRWQVGTTYYGPWWCDKAVLAETEEAPDE